jgi:outer membrane protein, multidrug efflux system
VRGHRTRYRNSWDNALFRMAAVAMLLLLCGCAVKRPPDTARAVRDSLPVTTTVPQSWTTRSSSAVVEAGWIKSFGDSQLEALVAEALQNNLYLQVAATRVDVASNIVTQAHSQLLPWAGATGSASFLGRFNQKNALGKDKGRFNASSLLAAVSWEADLWGRYRSQTAAARQQLAATEADVAFARQSLAAMVAKTWYLATYTQSLHKLALRNVELKQQDLDLSRVKLTVGAIQDQQVNMAAAEVASANSQLAQISSTHQQVLRGMEVLLGRYPSAELKIATTLAALPPPVPTGLPAQLLERRPDVIAAERTFDAAFHLVQTAKASRWPSISLTGGIGYMTNDVFQMLKLRPWVWSAGANIAAPLYTGGFLKSQVKIASADQRAALALYGQTVLQAFSEVEVALTNERFLREEQQQLATALNDAEEVYRLENVKYDVGQVDLQPVIQLEGVLLGAKAANTQAQYELLINRIDLHLALGGSF